jgi:hypothetical protein
MQEGLALAIYFYSEEVTMNCNMQMIRNSESITKST